MNALSPSRTPACSADSMQTERSASITHTGRQTNLTSVSNNTHQSLLGQIQDVIKAQQLRKTRHHNSTLTCQKLDGTKA